MHAAAGVALGTDALLTAQTLFEHVEGGVSVDNVFDGYHPIDGLKPGRALMVSLRAF